MGAPMANQTMAWCRAVKGHEELQAKAAFDGGVCRRRYLRGGVEIAPFSLWL
jgi:hypothetical protein